MATPPPIMEIACAASRKGQIHRIYMEEHRHEDHSHHQDHSSENIIIVIGGPNLVTATTTSTNALPILITRDMGPDAAKEHEVTWMKALELLQRGRCEGIDVILRHDKSEEGVGLSVAFLAIHSLLALSYKRGLKQAIPNIRNLLRASHFAGELPAHPTLHVIDWASRALIKFRWHENHVARIFGDELYLPTSSDDDQATAEEFTVYVGDRHSAESKAFFRHASITHIVNCGVAHGCRNAFEGEPGMRYINFDSDDLDARAPYPGDQWDAIMRFMREAKEQKASVLIHCVAGMNRSVTTLAIFMVLEGMANSISEAFALIKARRTIARPLSRYRTWAEQYVRAVKEGAQGGGTGALGEKAVVISDTTTSSSVRGRKDRGKRKAK